MCDHIFYIILWIYLEFRVDAMFFFFLKKKKKLEREREIEEVKFKLTTSILGGSVVILDIWDTAFLSSMRIVHYDFLFLFLFFSSIWYRLLYYLKKKNLTIMIIN